MIVCSPQGADGCGKDDGSGGDTAAEAGAQAEGASVGSGLGAWKDDIPAEEWTVGMVAGGVTVPATAVVMMATVALERIEVPPNRAQNHLGQAPYTPGMPMTSSS